MTVQDKIKDVSLLQEKIKSSKIILPLLFFLLGFLFSAGKIMDNLHPFGASIAAVSKKRNILFSSAGAIAGALLGGFDENAARYICAIVVAALGAFAAGVFELSSSPQFSMLGAFCAVLSTGVVLNIHLSATYTQYITCLGEAILSAGGAYFFSRALSANYKRLRLRALPETDIICIIISVSLLLMNLTYINIGIICPARLAAVTVILISVRFFKPSRAIAFALSFGFALSIAGESSVFIVGTYAFSAMFASLFGSLSSVAAGFAFLCPAAFFCIASGSDIALGVFAECTLSAIIITLLPGRLNERLENMSRKGDDTAYNGSLRQSLVLKLRFASSAMAAISESVEQVRDKINDITRRDNEKNRSLISDEEYLRREIILEKTNRLRSVASDQFFSIADMLEDLAFEFDEAEIFDAAASSKIRRLLGEYDIYPKSISVIEDKYSRMRVEILTENGGSILESPKIAGEIGKICSRYFEKGRITNFKNDTMLSFSERPNYVLEVGFAQHSAEGHLCGDTVKALSDGKGHYVLIISDGMGKGSRAALDGAMGAGLLSRLVNAGFGFDTALKVVNCALLVKSNDESLATLDIANIDLFTGRCELFKAGAPASYIIKNGSLTKCELTSMPAGILRGIEFAKRTAVLSPGDRIFLLSDGITDIGDEPLLGILNRLGARTAQESADYILENALALSEGKKRDDMSVIAASLERN